MYFQDPKQMIPILEIVKNTPELDKKSRNKIIKFKKIIQENKQLKYSKLKFYLEKVSSKLNLTKTKNSVKVLTLNTESQSTLRHVFGHFKIGTIRQSNSAVFHPILLDSGSQVTLISVCKLREIGLKEDKITSCQRYNIKSSTDLVEDCILGEISISVNLLMQQDQNQVGNVCKSKVTFLVGNQDVQLDRIILGIPFLNKHNIRLHFNATNCKVTGSFKNEQGFTKIQLQSNFGGENFIQCTNLTEIQPGHNIATFESSRILIQEVTASISAADSLNLKMPEIIKIRPYARIHFRKSGWPFIRLN